MQFDVEVNMKFKFHSGIAYVGKRSVFPTNLETNIMVAETVLIVKIYGHF